MMKYFYTLLLFCISFVFVAYSQEPTWEFLGLEGIGVLDIAIDDSSNIYVSGGPEVVYKSTNDGITWFPKNNGISVTTAGSLDMDAQANIYFTAFGGVFKTTDGGENWFRIAQELTDLEFYFIKVIPNDYIFVSNFDGIHRSIDYGATWFSTNYTYWGASQIGINSNGIMFAGNESASWASIYRSADIGINWTISSSFPPSALLFNKNGVIYAAVETNPFTSADIYKSTDDGISWDRTFAFITSGTIIYQDLELDRNGDFYVAIDEEFNGVHLSIDSVISWTYYGLFGHYIYSLAIDSSGYIYAGTSNGIYRTPGRTIPVELISFIVEPYNNDVELRWITATEANNYGFEVERKYGNEDWVKISFIHGNGTSTIEHIYTYADQNLESGNYLYRLKQIDYDGNYEYSSEIKVGINNDYNFKLDQNFPNPFNTQTRITFQIPEKSFIEISLYSILGEKLETLINKEFEGGEYELNLDISEFQSGVYFYKMISSLGFSQTKKLILLK